MKVLIAPGACSGHARCWSLAPELFELDDQGYLAFEEKEVPAGLEPLARRAQRACPERAIRLEGDDEAA